MRDMGEQEVDPLVGWAARSVREKLEFAKQAMEKEESDLVKRLLKSPRSFFHSQFNFPFFFFFF